MQNPRITAVVRFETFQGVIMPSILTILGVIMFLRLPGCWAVPRCASGSHRRSNLGPAGYGNTNEGKIIAAAFLDNYNNIVDVVRGDPSLQRNVGTLAQEAAAGGQTKAGAVFSEGDVLVPKIANVKVLSEPRDDAEPVVTLGRGEELVVIGAEQDGFINVQGADGAGWVKLVLMNKR
jgi:hypothetical protein